MITDKLAGLEELTGLPVEENDYGGDAEEYIAFDIADEYGSLYGDDQAQTVTSEIQMRVRLRKNTDYYPVKALIWDHLESEDFYNISFENYCEKEDGYIYRYLIFEFYYTEGRMKNE